MQAVQLSDVGFSYRADGPRVLSGISLGIKKGEFVGIIGKTGCGKSTLLLTLNGIIPQMLKGEFSGKVNVLGKDTSETPVHELARSVAFVFQDPDEQIFSLSVQDEVLFGLQNIGITGEEAKKRVRKALEVVGLFDYLDSDPHTLSQGQKQKLAFACALSVEPEIFVLDEPVSSLDYASASEIYSILKKLNFEGKTVILAEHDTEWLATHASRILFLDNGKIRADGSPLLLLDEKIKRAGIKVPCAARVAKEFKEKFLTPEQLVAYLKNKGKK